MDTLPAERLTDAEQIARAVANGVPDDRIIEALNLSSVQYYALIQSEPMQRRIEEYQKYAERQRRFTVGMAHDMYMEAYAASENATEMIKATDSMVKLHQLIPAKGPAVQVGVAIQNGNADVESVKFDRLSDAELIELANE